MACILFLIADTPELEDGNALRFSNYLLAAGHQVSIGLTDSLFMQDSRVMVRSFMVQERLLAGQSLPKLSATDPGACDVLWVLSLGQRESFLDKIQILYNLNSQVRIINSLEGLMYFKSKYFLASNPDVFQHPRTWASPDPEYLFQIMQSLGGKWIAKPPAGSLGRDVFLIDAADSNARAILQNLTGWDQDRYCLLQEWVPEITQGEKRVLLAGGQPVGQYLRTAVQDHRTNVMQGASVSACELTTEEMALCRRLGAFLRQHGVEYCGIDLAWPWVIEFNVINPGGLTTLAGLTGTDLTDKILTQILAL
ncbi:MAG: hypothetical protein KDI36_02630 [Pseudomonadales bacterium]|nr:hypothetical protein [Pseudomonadales bacterium]